MFIRLSPISLTISPEKPEVSLEYFFESPNLCRFNEQSIALYISGCPALHLFEVIVYHVTEHDEISVIQQMKHTLYDENWGTDTHKIIRLNDSKVQIYKLYSTDGIDSLRIIRHRYTF